MVNFDVAEIEKSIAEKGSWETQDEWRIFTPTSYSIAKIEELDQQNQSKRFVYAVRVTCDYEFRCESPTLKRAVEFCGIFQKWIEEGFSKYGWPSWVDKSKPKL